MFYFWRTANIIFIFINYFSQSEWHWSTGECYCVDMWFITLASILRGTMRKCATPNKCHHLATDWNLPTAVTNAKLGNCTSVVMVEKSVSVQYFHPFPDNRSSLTGVRRAVGACSQQSQGERQNYTPDAYIRRDLQLPNKLMCRVFGCGRLQSPPRKAWANPY